MKAVLYIILSVLVLIGLASVIRGIAYAIFCANWKAKICHIVLLNGDDCEIVIRDAVEQINWSYGGSGAGLFALDCGMDETSKQMATLILRDYNIPLCNIEDIGKVLKKA